MRRKDTRFVLYRHGPMSFHFVPRGWQGWAQLGIWMAIPVPLVMLFMDHVGSGPPGSSHPEAIILFAAAILFWLIGGYWWLIARAEEIDWSVEKRDRLRAKRARSRRNS